jgi:membrane-bound lytic murein transglycosylase A
MTYQGKIIDMGDCETAKGASGNCLIPYVSVAADPDYYQMGDIIEMPSMKGKEITLPSGRKMKHPGYFIVEDTGGAIRGRNRFDFFTGAHDMHDKANAFGSQGSDNTQMIAQNDCSSRKNFKVIRRGSANYKQSQVAIDRSLYAAGEETAFASNLSAPAHSSASDSYGLR